MASEVAPPFEMDAIRVALSGHDFEPDEEGDGGVRRVFIGTVFALLPSGKYYQPWACGNLVPCPRCAGRCTVGASRRRRVRKRAYARWQRLARLHQRGRTAKWHAMAKKREQARIAAQGNTCPVCDGLGSAEAARDQRWYEAAEAQLEGTGLSLASGEGDPCDLFIEEYGDLPEG